MNIDIFTGLKLKNLTNNYFFEFDSPSNLTKQLLSLLDNQRIEFIAFAITFFSTIYIALNHF